MEMGFEVHKEFMHNNLTCLVVNTDMGHRCGYVGITKKHPLHGVGYGEPSKFLNSNNLGFTRTKEPSMFSQLVDFFNDTHSNYDMSPAEYFDVWNSITYSEMGRITGCTYKPELWWYGYFGNQFNKQQDEENLQFCIEECKNLADQLIKVGKIIIQKDE